ncbi:hypothetical protein BJ878DRAFT_21889 [Calycina marina]|uniref:Elongator complex protein 6 n=1 Tax=Calycina marina TaxID=1763456 RepID=A0A9P8CFN9_9HELO|nr:hypothetical protein BJ878DRAFT_21889 [Calycina marina]
MSTRIPPLVESYLALPPSSLVLITSVLGASSNWLVLRFLHHALLKQGEDAQNETKVLLMSFIRNLAFWRENSRRLGLDLDKLIASKKFAFVDGLSGLFSPNQAPTTRSGEILLRDSELSYVSGELQQSIRSLSEGGGKVIMIIDQLDLLLAAGGDQVSVEGVCDKLLELRELVHATVMTVSADQPLVEVRQTPLETNHSAFLLGLAHQADLAMSLRLLDSGTARDVSGVVRITAGGQAAESGKSLERDLLYFVGGDGVVRVFERGQ